MFKSLCTAREPITRVKGAYKMEGNFCQLTGHWYLECTKKALNRLKSLNIKKPNNPFNKWANEMIDSSQVANKQMKTHSMCLVSREM